MYFISLIIYVTLSKKTKLQHPIDQQRMRGADINKIRFGVLEGLQDHFWPCWIFIFIFFSNTQIIYSAQYRPKLLQFGQTTRYSGGLDIHEWGCTLIKIQLYPNSGERS